MQTIWKYGIDPDIVIQTYRMPKGAIVLSIGDDPHGKMCFWAQVDPCAPLEDHLVACVGTGWEIDNMFAGGRYVNFVGTVTRGAYVWHMFDLGESVKDRNEDSHEGA